MTQPSKKKILAVASGGGHWIQLRRTMPAFDSLDIVYLTTLDSYRKDVPDSRFYYVKDASRWNKLGLIRMALQILSILRRERPDYIISTGAAAGYFSLRFGKFFGARTIWLDSIANVEELSLSGTKVQKYADLWLTQWPHLAKPSGPQFAGAVL